MNEYTTVFRKISLKIIEQAQHYASLHNKKLLKFYLQMFRTLKALLELENN